MSVSSMVLMDPKYNVEDIADFVKSIPGVTDVRVRTTAIFPNHHTITFSIDNYGKQENRSLNVFTHLHDYGIECTLCSLNAWGKYEFIMEKIWNLFGGFYCKNDCEEVWQNQRGTLSIANGLPFFLQTALISGKMKNEDDLDGLLEYIKEWKEKHNWL